MEFKQIKEEKASEITTQTKVECELDNFTITIGKDWICFDSPENCKFIIDSDEWNSFHKLFEHSKQHVKKMWEQ